MLRVKIEMCPRGDESDDKVREIGRMYIANVGGDIERGNYQVAVCRRGTTDVSREICGDHLDQSDPLYMELPRAAARQWLAQERLEP